MDQYTLAINALSESTTIVPGSQQVFRSDLNLFQVPDSDTSVINSTILHIDPLNSIKDDGPIIFNIPQQTERYLDPSSAYLYVQAKITNLDSSSIAENAAVAPSAYFYYLLFSQVDVSMNGINVTENCPCYPYRSVIKLMCTNNKAQEESFLTTTLAYRDTKINDYTDSNLGFKKRKEIAAGSKKFELIGDLMTSIFGQNRYIIPGMNIQLKLIRTPADFCIESSTVVGTSTACPYKVVLEKIQLNIKALEINPSVVNMHRAAFAKQMTAKYPYMDSKLAVSQIKSGTTVHLSEQLFQGKLPTHLIVCLIDAASMYGNYKKNAMDFRPHNLNYIKVKVDNPNVTYTCFNTDYANNLYLEAYKAMEDAVSDPSRGIVIDRDTFKNYNFYVFHLIPNIANNLAPLYRGVLRIECGFTSVNTNPINLVALGYTQSILEIDRDLNVHVT